jgi:hypothetical protein
MSVSVELRPFWESDRLLHGERMAWIKHDPFSGTIFVFRSKRGQQATFYIRFSFCGDRVCLAPAVRANAAGVAIPTRQGFDVHLHG